MQPRRCLRTLEDRPHPGYSPDQFPIPVNGLRASDNDELRDQQCLAADRPLLAQQKMKARRNPLDRADMRDEKRRYNFEFRDVWGLEKYGHNTLPYLFHTGVGSSCRVCDRTQVQPSGCTSHFRAQQFVVCGFAATTTCWEPSTHPARLSPPQPSGARLTGGRWPSLLFRRTQSPSPHALVRRQGLPALSHLRSGAPTSRGGAG